MTGLDPKLALALHAALSVAVVAAVLGVAWLLRSRGAGAGPAGDVYESGAPATSAMTGPVPAAYFQIAAFFVIFDFEAAVLYTWAMSAREAGLPGLVAAAVFILVLLAALAWLWADGALDTGPEGRREPLP